MNQTLIKIGLGLAIALLLCLFPMPYDYYTIVRFASMIIFACFAVVFFKDYFEKQKRDSQAEERRIERDTSIETARLEHERALAIILSESTNAVTQNQEVIKGTKRMHEDMDIAIERIESKIDELSEKISQEEVKQLEVLSTLLWIKETLRGLGEE